jgi:DnaK suppressor protein
MDARDLQRYKRLLLAKLDELAIAGAAPIPAAMAPGGWHGDVMDQSNAEADALISIRLHHSNDGLIRAIEDALARINHGRFGMCEVCKNPISKARLEVAPWGRLCRDCEQREQSAA